MVVSTVTSTVPADSTGVSAMIWLSFETVKQPAGDDRHGYAFDELTSVLEPKNTSVAPVNPEPVMVTDCSPPEPEAPPFGETPVTV